MDLRAWLEGLGLGKYADAFAAEDVDESILHELTEADLSSLGVTTIGHRKKILAAISARSRELAQAPASAAGASAASAAKTRPARKSERPVGETIDAADHFAESTSLAPSLRALLKARGYVITDRLGQGGMGEVFLAKQIRVDREVAIKVLRARDGQEDRARFEREARAIAALTHPHSVRLFDYVLSDDGSAGIVMEYVHGESLHALLARERRLPIERIGPILMQVADALAEAHAKGIVHRDLKPGNVLLQECDGYKDFAKVLDFGLARFASLEESRLTRSGMVFGTPRYLSPEQVLGLEVGPRSDLYSLGVLLYEALAGAPPFTGDIDAALMFKHVKEAPPALPADVERPAELDRIVERLLSKSPALRPSSAGALRRELAAVLARAPVEVQAPMPSSVPTMTERRQIVAVDVAWRLAPGTGGDEQVHELLRRCHARVDGIARRLGAHPNAREPWRAQLVFGAPIARRDDVRRALDAALELRTSIAALGEEGAAIEVAIGIADGVAVWGGIREGEDGGYFASGEPVARAVALREGAAAGEIRLAPSVADRAPPGFALGRPESGVITLRSRELERSASTPQPFVGRERELEAIAGWLAEARTTGRGRVIAITGEAGIGKSRLCDRVATLARGRGMRVARGACADVEVAPLEDALHQLTEQLLDLPADASDRVHALERRLGPQALRAEQWPFLYHFLGVALPGVMQRLYDAMDAPSRLGGYRDMLATLLAHESRTQPLVLMVEDVHWADRPTLDALDHLTSLAKTHAIAVIVSARAEDQERWRSALTGAVVERIELEPLGDAEALALAAELGLAAPARQAAVVARAGGHPLLITELARGRAEDGSLPHSVQGLVHARMDRLPEADRAAIQVASVLGIRFPLAHLRRVLGDDAWAPATLEEHRLLKSDEEHLAFAHGLVRDAVYGSLIEERRRALHARAAERLSDDLGLHAMHLDRAGGAGAALAYLALARAMRAGHHYEQARAHLDRALELAQGADRAPVLEELASLELELGDAARAHERWTLLRAIVSAPADVRRAELGIAASMRIASRHEDALAALARAEDAGRALGGEDCGRLHYLRGSVLFARGRLEESRASHARALEIARAAGDIELEAQALSGIADAHYGAGRLLSASRTWEQCIGLARTGKLLAVEATNLPMLAMMKVFTNESARARDLAAQGIDLARKVSRKRAEALARGSASLAALVRGELDDARAHAERAIELSRQLGNVVYEQTGCYYLGQAQLGDGELDAARETIDRGLALARAHGTYFVGAALLATRARLSTDRAERTALLDEGEALVRAGALSFNRFWFHESAIEVALEDGELARARRHADALVSGEEPLEHPRAMALRGWALADARERPKDDAARAAVHHALDVLRRAQLAPATRALVATLDAWGS